MVAYSFQARFMVPIVERSKTQTIRQMGSRKQALPGDTLQLYYAQRTKFCLLIGTAMAARLRLVWLGLDAGDVFYPNDVEFDPDPDAFAVRDGIKDWADLRAFWAQHHPGLVQFKGALIEWGNSFTPAPRA